MLNKNEIMRNFPDKLFVDNIGEDSFGENYINVTLGNDLKVYDSLFLDVKKSNPTKDIIIPEEGLVLEANKLYLGRTNEYTKTKDFVPMLVGLDGIAALGMEIHVTAGFGDNGFEGTWTLEIVCASPVRVYPGMIIGRLYYFPLVGANNITYTGKYLGQIKATESRIERDYIPVRKKEK